MRVSPISTKIAADLDLRIPLFGFSRSPGVVAEVSRAGGMGVFAASAYTPAELDAQLTWIEEHNDGRPFGVDLLVPAGVQDAPPNAAREFRDLIPPEHFGFLTDLLKRYGIPIPAQGVSSDVGLGTATAVSPGGVDELLDVAFSHPIALIANALGPPPERMITTAHRLGIFVAGLVGTADHARRQKDQGVDVLVAQGTEAGGHTGEVATMVLVPEIVALAGETPVLAAGGIASGTQMAAALALGAQGVWCGSVWLSSTEDITPSWMKEKFLQAQSTDTIRSRTRTGKPARQLKTPWHAAWESPAAPEPLPMQQQVVLMKSAWDIVDRAAQEGNEGARELGSFFVGQVVGDFTELRPTRRIVVEMVEQARAVAVGLRGAFE